MLDRSLPPGPEEPFSLNANLESFHRIGEWIQEYGDVFSLHTQNSNTKHIFINHPDLVKQIFVTEHKHMQKGSGFDRVRLLLGNGLIVSDGEFWKRQRRMITPMFHKDILKNVYQTMRECNVELLKKWQQSANDKKPVNVTKDTCYLALEIILRALFSEDFDEMSYKGMNPFFVLAEHTERDLDLVIKFRELAKYVRECMQDRISHNRFPVDYLSMLIQMEDKVSGERMTEKEIVDEVMTLIVAAHETTAATINWVWYLLSKHPASLAKVHEVTYQVSDVPPEIDELSTMPYIRQVIDEALRLYPPGWLISREALHDIELGNYQYSAGTNFFISPYYIHRHERYWQDADEFLPERFSPERSKNINRYIYFPFSQGQRRCSGEIFALLEMHMHIAYVSKHLDLQYIDESPIQLQPYINLRTEKDFYMHVSHRH